MTPRIGSIGWTDLTIPDAVRFRDFHRDVMAAAICPARGLNANQLPAT